MDPLEILEVRLQALAGDATEAQQHALTSWVIQEVAIDDWRHAANMVIEYLGDASGISTQTSQCASARWGCKMKQLLKWTLVWAIWFAYVAGFAVCGYNLSH